MDTARAARAHHHEFGGSPAHQFAANPAPYIYTPELPTQKFVQALARHATEVLDGVRNLRQLESWITPAVALSLRARTQQRSERDHMYGHDSTRPLYFPGTVRTQIIDDESVEAVVTIRKGERVFAVAMRLEWFRNRWRAAHLTVL